MKRYILGIFTLILILTTVSAQEQTVTATNDTTPALTKKELRKQRVARRNFHYNILGGPSYTPDFGALIGGSALMTFRMNPSDTTQLRSVLHMSIAYMFKGGVNLKRIFGAQALSVFVMPPSVDELQRRLEGRGTDSPETIARRVAKAEQELAFAPQFDRVVVNDCLATAVAEAERITEAFIG